MKLNNKEYQCDLCKEIFNFVNDENWSEEKANEEYKKVFPDSSLDNREIVCDDCWKLVRSN